ncbi:phosphatidylglycerophosphatase A [Fibrobacterales bacterium]|nr:phosphatidylglycerophosphatase A [Fibrobacterales bacterium]
MGRIQTRLAYAIATFFGVGYCPVASGTAGSLATLPVAFFLTFCGGFPALVAFTVIVYIAGTFASREVLKYTNAPPISPEGEKNGGSLSKVVKTLRKEGEAENHDPSIIVIDEVAGQMIPLTFFSVFTGVVQTDFLHWWLCIALPSFLLFRLFDITKPFPASYFDKKVLNAHGVMLDDIVAGLYALLVMVLWVVVNRV